MKCSKCQTENREVRKFCAKCGAKLILPCPQCGFENLPEEDFCGECGTDLKKTTETKPLDLTQPRSYTPKFLADKILTTSSSIEGERKVVTVLFADVANYTSLSEKLDPEEVHEIMDGCFRILMDEIHRYEGTINQFTGDGVMALFGAPVAHEDHARRACHAALAIQRDLAGYGQKVEKETGSPFKMRIGLNSGPVIVGAIGDDLRMDYTAVGDTTNLAARMQSLAEPGGILTANETHRLARDYFAFESMGRLTVKGKEEPHEAYALLRAGEVETRIEASVARGLTRFVGRERETAALREAYNKSASGSGQIVGIVGEAGVGKSRLLLELRTMLPPGSCTYLEGRCLHYGSAMPYLPVLDLLRAYLGIKEGEREFAIRKDLKEKVLALNLDHVLAPLQDLLSLKVEDEAYIALKPQLKRDRTFEALRDLFLRISQEKPLILAIEDLQWIDRTSHEFLDYLIGWLANTHILLILLYRPEFSHTWTSRSYYTQISVDQLALGPSAELVHSILAEGDVAPEIRDLILKRTAGNPLYMEEFTHSLVENGAIEKKDHQYVFTKDALEIHVPESIQGIIAARIDRLQDNLKRTMQVASVIGRNFAFRILQTITGMTEELKAHLLNLQGLEFIYEKQLFPELEYVFKHILTQEVAYNSLLVKRRKELHERIGKAIEEIYAERLEEYCEMLVYHYNRSDNADKTVTYLDLANQKARRLGMPQEAKALFDEAMKVLDGMPETEENLERRLSLLLNQSWVFVWLLNYPEYDQLLRRWKPAVAKISNPGLVAEFYLSLSGSAFFGDLQESLQLATKALEIAESSGCVREAGHAYLSLTGIHYFLGNLEQSLEAMAGYLRLMQGPLNLEDKMNAHTWSSSTLILMGRWEEAVEGPLEVLSDAEAQSNNSVAVTALAQLASVYCSKGDLTRALEYGTMAVQKSQLITEKLGAELHLGRVLCRTGDPQRGIDLQIRALEIVKAAGVLPYVALYQVLLADSLYHVGRQNEAHAAAQAVLELSESMGMKGYLGRAHLLLGATLLKTDPLRASEHLKKSIAVFQEIKSDYCLAQAFYFFGRLQKMQGSFTEARRYFTVALEMFEHQGTLIQPDLVRAELANLDEV